MRGRINYTSMSMVGDSCESRFRQNFQRSFDWLGFNMQFAAKMAKWGLEILGIAVVNADTKEAVHLEAVQTFKNKKKQIRKVYFSTDRTLSGQDIFDLYRTRFQIEFLYRSGKGLTGLTHCQARNEQALDFAFNMSLSTINLMRSYAANLGFERLSDASVMTLVHNAFMIDRFISTFGKPPKLRKNDNTVNELLFYGVRDAA